MKTIFMHKLNRKVITPLLLAFFVLSISHNLFHNSFDHVHDATCSVYVVEELFTSTDVVLEYKEPATYLTISYIDSKKEFHSFQAFKHYSIRAPPANFFLS